MKENVFMAEVTRYTLTHLGTANGIADLSAQIYFYNVNTLLGYIFFHSDNYVLPKDIVNSGVIQMALPDRKLTIIIDTLRNEKPLYLNYAQNAGYGYLSTNYEPVGEEELT
jgi:hypothetical protein